MKCPLDNTELVITDRQGVEIDYCPQCRGVWLDRGELDKLIDRSAAYVKRDDRDFSDSYDRRKADDYAKRKDDEAYRKKRRKSFLGEIFDFD